MDDSSRSSSSQSEAEDEWITAATLLLTTERRGNGLAQQSWCHIGRERNETRVTSLKDRRLDERQMGTWRKEGAADVSSLGTAQIA